MLQPKIVASMLICAVRERDVAMAIAMTRWLGAVYLDARNVPRPVGYAMVELAPIIALGSQHPEEFRELQTASNETWRAFLRAHDPELADQWAADKARRPEAARADAVIRNLNAQLF